MKIVNVITLCCGRHDLYSKMLDSFIENVVFENTNLFFNFFVHDDSGSRLLNSKIENILINKTKKIKNCKYNFYHSKNNLGQTKSMIKLVSNANFKDTDLIFQIEEDFTIDEKIRIEEYLSIWEKWEDDNKDNLPKLPSKLMQIIFRTDAHSDLEMSEKGLINSRKNIVSIKDNKIVLCSNIYKNCSIYGGSIINNDLCCHPHLSKGFIYNKLKNQNITFQEKSTAEDVLGMLNLEYGKMWINDKVYSSHIGSYRYYSVFKGAKIRSETSCRDKSSVSIKTIPEEK